MLFNFLNRGIKDVNYYPIIMILNKIFFSGIFFIFLGATECPRKFIEIDEVCYYKKHLDVLQDIIDINENLWEFEPWDIGIQKWEDGKLTSLYLEDHLLKTLPNSIGLLSNLNYLDLSKNQLINLPEEICHLYPLKANINLEDNYICPLYPSCFEYISHQNTNSCKSFNCPDEYIEIEGECYKEEHIKVLQVIIDNNESLNGSDPLELGQEIGYQQWENGKLIILHLMSNKLTNIPEELCSIYQGLKSFNVSNNSICPPYPHCFNYIGSQNTLDCIQPFSCPEGYVAIDETCYYGEDIQVLIEFIKINPEVEDYQPLMLGRQAWENKRLQSLYLDGLKISNVPESIKNLDKLAYLNLNNNKLQTLPEALCEIYPNLNWIDLTNNYLCPPYIGCFDYVGQQNTENCHHDFCPSGYKDINEECYFEKDIVILQDFIDENISLSGRNPLEIGVQKWKNMRLDFLFLGSNELTIIPESICKIYNNLSSINISRNKLCPPYPDCIDDNVGSQNLSNCQ